MSSAKWRLLTRSPFTDTPFSFPSIAVNYSLKVCYKGCWWDWVALSCPNHGTEPLTKYQKQFVQLTLTCRNSSSTCGYAFRQHRTTEKLPRSHFVECSRRLSGSQWNSCRLLCRSSLPSLPPVSRSRLYCDHFWTLPVSRPGTAPFALWAFPMGPSA